MTSLLFSRSSGPFLLIGTLALAAACGGGDEPGFGTSDSSALPGPVGGGDAGVGAPGGATPSGTAGGGAAPGAAGGAATGGGAAPGGAAGGAAGGGDASVPLDGGGSVSSGGLPCNVKKIVDAKCAATCHSDPPQGTFMALKTQAQWQVAGTTDKTKKYFELAKTRVMAGTMPPAASGTLTADEKTTLMAWLNQGAPASNETCASTGGDAGAPIDPSKIDTTGLDCYKFLAHAQGDKTAKFKVGAVKDAYWNFGFKAPWPSLVYGVLVRPVIDNAKVLHHWLIYREDIADGLIEKTIGQHSGGELIHGWAPGGTPMDFREHGDDVAFELPPTSYAVEFHYNSDDANALDASGVEICVRKTPPKNIAGMSWLGWDQGGVLSYASGICLEPSTSWTGTCKPQNQTQPINLLFMNPHLHQAGRHLKAVITGKDGKTRTLHDKAFDFNYQVSYTTKEVLMPGETITTTCTYSEPKCAGQSTSQEMCYLFTYAWPKKALVDNGSQGKLMHGEGVCLGQ
jgi:hypothetical protein